MTKRGIMHAIHLYSGYPLTDDLFQERIMMMGSRFEIKAIHGNDKENSNKIGKKYFIKTTYTSPNSMDGTSYVYYHGRRGIYEPENISPVKMTGDFSHLQIKNK